MNSVWIAGEEHLSDLTRLVIAPEDCDSLPKPHFQADQQRHLNISHHSSETNMIWRSLLRWNVDWKRSEPFRRCSSPCQHSRPWKGNLCRETFRQFEKVPSGRGTGRARRRTQLRGISPDVIVRISLIDHLGETCLENLTSCTLLSLLRISFAFSQSVFTWDC